MYDQVFFHGNSYEHKTNNIRLCDSYNSVTYELSVGYICGLDSSLIFFCVVYQRLCEWYHHH